MGSCLFVHVDAGHILHVRSDSSAGAARFSHGITNFVREPFVTGEVRILACKENAALIAAMCGLRQLRVQVGNPELLNGVAPADVMKCLWYDYVSADSICSWYPLLPTDYFAYSLAARPTGNENAALNHPAWSAATFPSDHEPEAAVEVLAKILDPRWFCHPDRPSRLSRLMRRFSAIPGLFRQAISRGNIDSPANLIVRAWSGQPLSAAPLRLATTAPRDFLHRTYLGGDDHIDGLVCATRRYLSLICGVWNHRRQPFDSSLFFPSTEEALAFKEFDPSRALPVSCLTP